jgi:hypothetical protein
MCEARQAHLQKSMWDGCFVGVVQDVVRLGTTELQPMQLSRSSFLMCPREWRDGILALRVWVRKVLPAYIPIYQANRIATRGS